MNLTRYITAFIWIHCAFGVAGLWAQEAEQITGMVDKASLPVPHEKGQLFYLQRDPNTNTVIYRVNMLDGKINTTEPVQAYWIRYAEKGQRSNLTFLQENMAYGVHVRREEDTYQLRIRAYKPLLITVAMNNKTGQYEALVTVDDKPVILDRIFVRIRGGSLFKPKIEYVEIKGRSSEGKEIIHQFEV